MHKMSSFLPPIMSFTNVTGLGRAAQATALLERVLNISQTDSSDNRLRAITHLDADLQYLLSLLLEQCRGLQHALCASIAICIK